MPCKYKSNATPNPGQHHSSSHLLAHSNAQLVFLFHDLLISITDAHCTLAGSYSEGATLSQFIILTKKGKTLVKTVERKGFFFIIF